jgi:hypothetical protein
LPSRSTRFGLFEQARLIWINRLLQRFSLVCRRGCATIHHGLALPKNCCDAQSKNSNARRPLVLQADIGVERQLRDFARGEQAFVKPGPRFGRLSTKAFDVGDETVDDETDDAVIGERHAL